MSILIIALPRTGSSELGRRLSTYNKFKYEFEPFNPSVGLPPLSDFKKIVLKTIIFHLPYYIKEENRINWLIELTKNFDEVVLLSRKNLTDCAESWSYLMHKEKQKSFKSNQAYLWEKTPNYNEEYLNIIKWNEELKFISTELNIPITYYEDIYNVNDSGKLRKGNLIDYEKKII
jgi:hypothetical protein